MKKVISVLLACALVFSMSITAFAAGSAEAEAEVSKNVEAVVAEEEGITVSAITESDAGYAAAVELYSAPAETLASVVADEDVADYSLAALVDISGEAAGAVTISFAGITASSKVIVLHYVDGAWKQESATAGDGKITIYADSFSPFAIYVVEDDSTAIEDTDDDTTSPTTGESNVMLYVAIVAIIAAAGLTVSGRKIRG